MFHRRKLLLFTYYFIVFTEINIKHVNGNNDEISQYIYNFPKLEYDTINHNWPSIHRHLNNAGNRLFVVANESPTDHNEIHLRHIIEKIIPVIFKKKYEISSSVVNVNTKKEIHSNLVNRRKNSNEEISTKSPEQVTEANVEHSTNDEQPIPTNLEDNSNGTKTTAANSNEVQSTQKPTTTTKKRRKHKHDTSEEGPRVESTSKERKKKRPKRSSEEKPANWNNKKRPKHSSSDEGGKAATQSGEDSQAVGEGNGTTATTPSAPTTYSEEDDKYVDLSSELWYLNFRDRHNLPEPWQLPVSKKIVEIEDVRYCRCPRVVFPICATNEITYMNMCIMKCMKAEKRRYGPCINYRRSDFTYYPYFY